MLPLGLFRSRMFTAVNLLTLFLYAALAGSFFFLPFALIQVQGFSATLAGAAFLPFTLIMAALSRGRADCSIVSAQMAADYWAHHRRPRHGTIGIACGRRIHLAFLLPIAIFALGMVVSVAPLTTTVINAVPAHQTGVAAGINNAASSVANLLAIAILGALALGVYNRALVKNLETKVVSGEVRRASKSPRGNS